VRVVTRWPLVLCLALVCAGAAQALPVEACVAQSGTGQEQQKAGHLRAARAAFTACADESCPEIVRTDCTHWLADVVASTPSIVVAVRMDGVDRQPEAVLLDGQPWMDHLSGTPVDVEPGLHRLGVRVDGRVTEQKIVFNIGEKNRLIVFQLGPVIPDVTTLPSVAAPTPVTTPSVVVAPAPARSAPWIPVAATALAVAGAGLFTAFGLSGKWQLAGVLSDPCSSTKTCAPSRVADVQQRFLAADISLGVGIASALVATWRWWAWASEDHVTAALIPSASGAAVSLSGRF
jgi:hypothetical protein